MRPEKVAAAGGLAPPFTDSKSAVLLIRRHRNKSGQGDRTCTCMISLPRGVADYLAPHPDVKLNRPGGRCAPGRCCFLSLASQRAAAVVGTCDEHETDNREPRDCEGSDHIVVLSVLGPCSEELRPFNARTPRTERARNWSSASVMLRAMPACRAGDVTGCLADEKMAAGVGFAPTSRRLTGGRSTVELPGNGRGGGTRTPVWLDVSQLPWLLGDTSKVARPTGAAPAISCSTGRRLC